MGASGDLFEKFHEIFSMIYEGKVRRLQFFDNSPILQTKITIRRHGSQREPSRNYERTTSAVVQEVDIELI